ncbi:MAG: glycosyltransferase [Nitrococcus sp.]|nr:glycosyltransferase [Nitrococcus sp.]
MLSKKPTGRQQNKPALVVLSLLFPHAGQPIAGSFILERMGRVARHLPVTFVAPVPWFPFQGLVQRFRSGFRPPAPQREVRDGQEILFPRFLSVPGLFKSWDGFFMALCVYPLLYRLRQKGRADLIDAHWAYPEGDAAAWLGLWLKLPVTITLRGKEVRLSGTRWGRRAMLKALARASRVFSVSESLRRHMVELGANPHKIQVVPNGVDVARFHPVDKQAARRRLGLAADARLLITVGGLVERKGQHRVIQCLPRLLRRIPNLHYLIVGGASTEGDWGHRLQRLAHQLNIADHVTFCGVVEPDELRWPLSAADAFVLATRGEGWANVLLEAMSCGLPVVATDVGGNAEVVCDDRLGLIVPFGDEKALGAAIEAALTRSWSRDFIIEYARRNTWDSRVAALVQAFLEISGEVADDKYENVPSGVSQKTSMEG